MNPWIGPDSQFSVHQDELAPYYGELPSTRELVPDENITGKNLNMIQSMNKVLKKTQKDLNESTFLDLIEARLKVRWTAAQGAAGVWNGTVIDYELRLGKH